MNTTQSETDKTLTPTWDLLARCESRLADLERIAKAVHPADAQAPFCANDVWYGGLRGLLSDIVGWSRGYPPVQADNPYSDPNQVTWKSIGIAEILDRREDRQPSENEWEDLLRSRAAYDIAYEHLYGLLPDCRGCSCA